MFIEYAGRPVKVGVATSRQLKPKINIMPPRTTSMSRYDSQPNASGRAAAVKSGGGAGGTRDPAWANVFDDIERSYNPTRLHPISDDLRHMDI
jgi:hypothetical protein